MMEKSELIQAIAATNRGLLATEAEKQSISVAIAKLEALNPTPLPFTSAGNLLHGDWRLLYTTSVALLNLDKLPLSKLGQVYQCIRVDTTSIYNIAEIYGLPYLEGIISVAAAYEPVSERRVQVKFQRSLIGLQKLINYSSPANLIQQFAAQKNFLALDFPIQTNRQAGWLDITYLDDNLRIGRGNEGSVFVLGKS
jgi:hypothetical protein